MNTMRPSYEELEQQLRDTQATLDALIRSQNTMMDASKGKAEHGNAVEGSRHDPHESDGLLTSRLIAAFNAMKDLIWIMDANYRVMWSNQAGIDGVPCCRLMINEKPCYELLHGVSEPIPGCPVVRAKQSMKRERLEIKVDERYYEITVDPYADNNGRFNGCVHIISDITAVKHAQLARQKTENLFSWLAEKATDIIFRYELKPHRGFTYVSPAATLITGYTPEEHYADPDLGMKIVHPDDRHLLEAYFSNTGSFNTPLELRWVRKDGSAFWTEQRNVPVYDKDGEIIAIEGIARDITSRKVSEERQKELERKLQTIIENIDGTVYRCKFDPNWTMEYISPACKSLTGYAPEELINNSLLSFNDIIRPDWREYCWQVWQDALPNQQTVELEYPIVTRTGEVKWVWERGCGIFNAEGNLIALEGFITDITERRNADEELRKLSRTVEQSPVSVIITDTKGIIEYVNEKFTRLTGFSKSEAIGQNPRILQSGVQGKQFYQKMWDTISKGQVWTGELCNKKKNGELYWESAIISPIRNLNGEISHYVGVKEDITEQKRTATGNKILIRLSNLLHEEENLERFFEVVRQELAQLYDTKNFFAARYFAETDTLKKWVFYDENDSFDTWDAKISLSGHVAKLNTSILLQGNEISEFGIQHGIPITGTKPLCWLGVPIVVRKMVYGVLVVQDYQNVQAYGLADKGLLEMVAHEIGVFIEKQQYLRDLIRAKEKAEESDRLKSAFLANMSHEIRTPMNGILGFSELLKAPDLSSEEREEYIALINKSGERMLNIINDIIDISRIEAGVVELHPEETDINEQVDFIFNFFIPQANEKGLKLLLNNTLKAEQSRVITDKEKVYAILTNLVKNAIKYTHHGQIEIGCSGNNDLLEFYVKDTGIGIPADRLSAIFERFVQADIEDRMAYQGAGLGLAITKAYVDMLGGKIWVESEVGQGSTFRFTLPVSTNKADADGTAQLPKPAETTGKKEKPNVLIVEDDDTSVLVLRRMIQPLCDKILWAENGAEAVETVRQNPDIDLILMDMRMPIMNGYEATKKIREFDKDVIIVAQTAYAMVGDRELSIEAGCNDYITKPISKEKLIKLISNNFRMKEEHTANL